jgi:hypothetical protein
LGIVRGTDRSGGPLGLVLLATCSLTFLVEVPSSVSHSPLFIRHRVNSGADLASVDPAQGVEIDLRSSGSGELHLAHDPWQDGERFRDWLAQFAARGLRGPLIVNTKEDGLETRALEELERAGVRSFFFLDTTLPTLVRWTRSEGRRCFAVRCSQFEPPSLALAFKGLADWVWVDCFGAEPLPASTVAELKPHFRLCLVSPELQGQSPPRVERFSELFALADAVCTKVPEVWQAAAMSSRP